MLNHSVKRLGFSHVVYLPCSVFKEWYTSSGLDSEILVCREEEAIGIAVGLTAAGGRPLILMQNSGLGNSINAVASLAIAYRVPLVVGVSLAGDSLDLSVARRPIGRSTVDLIDALGCDRQTVSTVEECDETLASVLRLAVQGRKPAFCLFPRKELLVNQGCGA